MAFRRGSCYTVPTQVLYLPHGLTERTIREHPCYPWLKKQRCPPPDGRLKVSAIGQNSWQLSINVPSEPFPGQEYILPMLARGACLSAMRHFSTGWQAKKTELNKCLHKANYLYAPMLLRKATCPRRQNPENYAARNQRYHLPSPATGIAVEIQQAKPALPK